MRLRKSFMEIVERDQSRSTSLVLFAGCLFRRLLRRGFPDNLLDYLLCGFLCRFLNRGWFDQGLNLLVHVELDVVITAAVLTARARAFPAAEGLEARPGAGRCPL